MNIRCVLELRDVNGSGSADSESTVPEEYNLELNPAQVSAVKSEHHSSRKYHPIFRLSRSSAKKMC